MHTLGELARRIEGELDGPPQLPIQGVNRIEEAGPEEITYAVDARAAAQAAASRAGAVVIPRGLAWEQGRYPKPAVRAENPRLAFARLLEIFSPPPDRPAPGIHPGAFVMPGAQVAASAAIGAGAVVGPRARIGERVVVYPQVYIGAEAQVGDDSILYPQVVVRERVRIGRRVILHPGAVIGADGFSYVTVEGVHRKLPQNGTVVIEDDVEVGANSCVDRATVGETRVGRGTKIDNLVQVGHNVRIGPGCLVVAQVGIAGSARIGAGVTLAGQAGVADHVTVGDGAVVAANSVVASEVEAGEMVSGFPARPHRQHLRSLAALNRLPEALRAMQALQRRVEELEQRLTERDGSPGINPRPCQEREPLRRGRSSQPRAPRV